MHFHLCEASIRQVGGFYISNIPVWISWLKYASFIFYSYNLLLKARLNLSSGQSTFSQRASVSCCNVLLFHAVRLFRAAHTR